MLGNLGVQAQMIKAAWLGGTQPLSAAYDITCTQVHEPAERSMCRNRHLCAAGDVVCCLDW